MEEVKEESSQNCSDSEDSSGSQSSSTVEAEDIESDFESLEEHYYSDLRQYSATLERDFPAHYTTQQLNTQEWDFHGNREGIQRFLSLPTTWPLARLVFPIRDLRKQMETLFFLLHAAKVRSSCEEGPGQSALQSAYHNPKLDVNELKQNRTPKVVQAKNCKQTN